MVNNGRVEPDAPTSEQRPATLGKREGRSPRDMALSLAILLIPIALLLAFYRGVLDGEDPMVVDPGPAIDQARSAALFPVAAPQGLGDDWRPTAASFRRQSDGATLRIGYVGPGDDPVLLVQSSVPAQTLLPVELGDKAEVSGTFRAASGVWRQYDARPGEQALVLTEPDRTIVVVGRTDVPNLQTVVASLS